jgi:hypothetical protein
LEFGADQPNTTFSPFSWHFEAKEMEGFDMHEKRKNVKILWEMIQKPNHSPGETEQHESLQHPELPANTKAEMK